MKRWSIRPWSTPMSFSSWCFGSIAAAILSSLEVRARSAHRWNSTKDRFRGVRAGRVLAARTMVPFRCALPALLAHQFHRVRNVAARSSMGRSSPR